LIHYDVEEVKSENDRDFPLTSCIYDIFYSTQPLKRMLHPKWKCWYISHTSHQPSCTNLTAEYVVKEYSCLDLLVVVNDTEPKDLFHGVW